MWQLVNCLFTASYSLYLRGTMDRVVTLTANRTKLDEFSMVFYNNLLSLPLIGVLMWWCVPGAGALSLLLSGALVWRCAPGAGAAAARRALPAARARWSDARASAPAGSAGRTRRPAAALRPRLSARLSAACKLVKCCATVRAPARWLTSFSLP